MKKAEIIAMQNRLEYLKDKVDRLSVENRKFKAGLDELQTATELLIKNVAYEYGKEAEPGKRKEIWLPRVNAVTEDYDVEVKLDECRQKIGVILTKKK